MGRYRVPLVGEASYQGAIRHCTPGEIVILEHEPQNQYDDRAIRAISPKGETIGYIPRDSWVRRAFHEDGTDLFARIEELLGGTADKPSLGVLLTLYTAQDAMAAAEAAAQEPAQEPGRSKGDPGF